VKKFEVVDETTGKVLTVVAAESEDIAYEEAVIWIAESGRDRESCYNGFYLQDSLE
jgi:hypothetical protein